MNDKAIHQLLESAAEILGWRRWSTGVLTSGIYYLEVETTNQYEEVPFDTETELSEYVAIICSP